MMRTPGVEIAWAYDGVLSARAIRFCDFASAANTWDDTTRCRVWCPEVHYHPAD